MNHSNRSRVFRIDGFQQLEELHLALAVAQNADHFTAAQIELVLIGDVSGLGCGRGTYQR